MRCIAARMDEALNCGVLTSSCRKWLVHQAIILTSEVCFMIRFASAVALAFAVACCTGAWAQAPAQAVKERQEIMKQIWPAHYRDIARAARDGTDLAAIPAKATAAADTVKKFGTLFPPGSGGDGVPDTRAKPEVFTQKAEFDAAVAALVTSTNALGEA